MDQFPQQHSQIDLMNQIRALQAQLARFDCGIMVDSPSSVGYPPNCRDNNKSEEGGLTMIGVIRTRELCPVCHQPFSILKRCQKCHTSPKQITQKKCTCGGNFKVVEVPIICPTCRTYPSTFFFDLSWKDSLGKTQRFKFYQDPQTGQDFDSWHACHRFAEHIRREVDTHGFDPSQYLQVDLEKYRFENYAQAWFDRASPTLTPGTFQGWKCILKKYLIPHFGRRDIRRITNGEIADFLSGIKSRGASGKSAILTVLKRMYANAVERQDITTKPNFPSVKPEKSKHNWLNKDDQSKVLSHIPESNRPIFEFMMLTGMRPGEVRALKKDCIFFQEKLIVVKRTFSYTELRENPKDGEMRVIPMGKRAEEILKAQAKTNIFSDFVFVNRLGRHYAKCLTAVWKRACEKAGVKITMYQGTKHSFFTQKLNQGHTLDELAAIAGHSSTYMTEIYAKMQVESLRSVMEDENESVPGTLSQVRPRR